MAELTWPSLVFLGTVLPNSGLEAFPIRADDRHIWEAILAAGHRSLSFEPAVLC